MNLQKNYCACDVKAASAVFFCLNLGASVFSRYTPGGGQPARAAALRQVYKTTTAQRYGSIGSKEVNNYEKTRFISKDKEEEKVEK